MNLRKIYMLVIFAWVLTAGKLDAAENNITNKSPFSLNLSIDLPIIMGTGTVGILADFIKSEFSADLNTTYDREKINAFDRPVTNYWSTGSQKASDVFLFTSMAYPYVIDFVDVVFDKNSDGINGFGRDAAVITEALAVNFFINQIFKYSVIRSRPYMYNPDVSAKEKENYDSKMSFYSGHTSIAFTMATSYSYLFFKRHPDSRWKYLVMMACYGMAGTTGVLRVLGGKHFWTDVMAGAVMGTSIGFLIPYFHTNQEKTKDISSGLRINPAVDHTGYRGFNLVFAF